MWPFNHQTTTINPFQLPQDALANFVSLCNRTRQQYRIAKTTRDAMPTIKLTISQMKYLAAFNTFIAAAGVATQIVEVYQNSQINEELQGIRNELVAHTGLEAPEIFATQVYRYIRTMTQDTRDSPEHFYFVYHPDNDWHGAFGELVERRPLSASYFGMCNSLDMLCVWMQFIRNAFVRNGKWGKRVVFHLLIPAYRSLVIKEPFKFSESLQPLRIHGFIAGGDLYVKMNLYGAEENMLDGIDIWRKPRVWFGRAEVEIPRTLGLPRDGDEDIILSRHTRRVHKGRR